MTESAEVIAGNLFVAVPETTLPGGIVVPAFKVGQYACSKDVQGKILVRASDPPWVSISYHDAKNVCAAFGFKLITELQWLAIAHDAARQDCNWTGGRVGEGELFTGLRNENTWAPMPGDQDSEDPGERRWLTLSNGSRICDLNGNVYQWVFDDVQGDKEGIIAHDFAPDSPSITTAPYPSRTHGMGSYKVSDWSENALTRGGYWRSGDRAGAFYLNYSWPDHPQTYIGFRCTL
jgi:formylglycine-generating enzyme required for sulfatase activity